MSGLLDKGKGLLSNNYGSSGTDTFSCPCCSSVHADHACPGLDVFEEKEGIPDNRATNEKITDGARSEFESVIGCIVSFEL
ncbi:hypothetical protein DFH09DRAFT_928670 [Mycena vulgaris]|nr:hypothetical protein DFH09DRAFT_928670 [Mycena vulgaris]